MRPNTTTQRRARAILSDFSRRKARTVSYTGTTLFSALKRNKTVKPSWSTVQDIGSSSIDRIMAVIASQVGASRVRRVRGGIELTR